MSNWIKCSCSFCGASFLKMPAEIKRTRNNFCGKSCSGRFKAKKNHEEFMGKAAWEGDCLVWKGNLNGCGYGFCKINRKVWLSHRYSYLTNKGQIPEGLCVMHSCDNPACINPVHLSLGTHEDNMIDKMRKGRAQHIISRADKVDICNSTQANKELAVKYGVSERTIRHAKTMGVNHWQPLPEPPEGQ